MLVNLSSAFFFAYGKILFTRPCSSVDRVLASEAEDRSSSLRGGAKENRRYWRFFVSTHLFHFVQHNSWIQ